MSVDVRAHGSGSRASTAAAQVRLTLSTNFDDDAMGAALDTLELMHARAASDAPSEKRDSLLEVARAHLAHGIDNDAARATASFVASLRGVHTVR